MYTKEELESKSDFELSLDICITLDEETLTFDINNPSDMMPLVFDSGIGLSPNVIGEWVSSARDTKEANWDGKPPRYMAIHKNPLRAAAIVYLLMKGE